MYSLHFFYSLVVSTLVAAYSDWLFAGDIWMRFYGIYPASWRTKAEGFRERPAIAGSILLTLLTCVVMLALLQGTQMHGYSNDMMFAVMVWLVAPMPLLFTQCLWMKYPWQLAAVHSLGWFVKLIVIAVAAAVFQL